MPLVVGPPWFVAIGGSGPVGLDDIGALLGDLPDALRAVVLVVLHRPWDKKSQLRSILSRSSRMPVVVASEAHMFERRTLLAGLAALPVAGLPLAAMAASAHADPFTRYGDEIPALHTEIAACKTDETSDPLMDRWGEIDAQAMAGQPTTLAGALGALDYARREMHQFHVAALEDVSDDVCPGDRLVLHLLDGAIAVLRQATNGGVA